MGKGFNLAHTKVTISINLDGKIRGSTEITIIPTVKDLKTVWLNARSLKILSTSLKIPTSIPLAFSYLPPAPPTLTEPSNIHTYPELKRSIWRATNEGEEGELGIGLPVGCIVKVPPVEGATPLPGQKEVKKVDEWEPIVIVVEYEVNKPGEGIIVVGPDDANPSRFPHVFTSPLSDIAARTWLPCSDYYRDRCTWDLEFIVPRLLYSSSNTSSSTRPTNQDEDLEIDLPPIEDDSENEWPITVVSSGELIEQVVHPDRSDRVIWHYMQATPVSVQQLAWAVGPFVITEIVGTPKEVEKGVDGVEENEDDEVGVVVDEGPKIHALCLPGREVEMGHSVGIIRQAMDYYSATFGSYPFSTYTVAFIDSLASGTPTFHSAAMTLLSSDHLHPPAIIDQAYETRHLLAHALAVQWSGINLIPKAASDSWLVVGIALHITSLFLKNLWGNNEYRFRLKKDMIRCVAQDVQREPLSAPARPTQPEQVQLQFIALKAPLVLHILDKHLRKAGTSLGLDKVLPKLFLDAITGDVGSSSTGPLYNTLSTTYFIRTCRKACGGSAESLKAFFDQWVYGSGCPTFMISAMFNRKKMAVELNVKQECLAYNWAQSAPWEENGHLRPIPLFDGQMTIRIHEADGTPYEHVLNIQDQFKRHEVPFNTKYKRIRRNTKRYQARQAAATAAASGDKDAEEDVGLIDLGFGLGSWEEEAEREKWRVADWTEEDDTVMSQATYEWIRIDADLEWICGIQFEQPDFMWLSQLQRDRDVIAQLEAVHALSRMPSAIVSSNLCKTVLVENYFFRIRMEAALALISCATKPQSYLGLFHLFKLFQSRYCFDPDVPTVDPFGFRCIPKTHDFKDIPEYFIKKTLLTAISMVRDELGQTPPVVQQFLVDLLAFNDNLGNPFSDTFYIASIINALGHSLVAIAPREAGQFTEQNNMEEIEGNIYLQPAIEEVERYMSTDKLVPSYHNAITVAGIEWKIKLTLASLIPEDRFFFFCYTRDGNYPPVRVAAFDALLLLNPLQEAWALVRYFFSVMREDSSRLVQRRLAQGLLESLPVLSAIHDLAAPDLVFEEEGVKKEKDKDKDKDVLGNVLKSLRKKPGRSVNYRQHLLQTLIYPEVDPDVRLCLLKICEATVRPEGEPLPKIRMRVQPVEAAPLPSPVVASPHPHRLTLTNSIATKITLPPRSGASTPQPDGTYDQGFDLPLQEQTSVSGKKKKKLKIKVAPKQEKSQASGMAMSDVASCKSLIKKLLKEKASLMFRSPVDPVKSGAPGYFDTIKRPMDISTMHQKLLAGQYPDRYAFRDDFKLIVSNARLYNISGMVVDQADKLDATFNKQWERIQATLRKMESDTPISSRPSFSFSAPIVDEEDEEATFIIPPPPPPPSIPKTLSLKIKAPFVSIPSPSPVPSLSPYPSDSTKPKGFKITLGGSSVSSPVTPLPSAIPKLPKVHKSSKKATFAENLEYGATSVPMSAFKSNDYSATSSASSIPSSSGTKITFSSSSGSSSIKKVKEQGEKREKGEKGEQGEKGEKGEKKEKREKKEKKEKKEKEKKEKHEAYDQESIPKPTMKIVNYADVADPEVDIIPEIPLPVQPEIFDLPPLPKPSSVINPNDNLDLKRAKTVLGKMLVLRESFFFLHPVEAVGALATYYQEIAEPMDLQTMGRKLEQGSYRTYGQFFDDFDLIVSNCRQFNTPGSEPIWHAMTMDRNWRMEWEKASKLPFVIKRSLLTLIKNTMKEGAAFPFLVSINTILDQIPNYYDIIPRGNERDLGTIKADLERDYYTTIEAVEADVALMLHNCFTFNTPDSPVYKSGEEVKKIFSSGTAKIKADGGKSSKRAGDIKLGGSSSKKQKV